MFKKLKPLLPKNLIFKETMAAEVPLSLVVTSGCATNTASISSKTPCLTIMDFVPPRYSPGHPITIAVPPILSITLESAKEAPKDIVVNKLCPVKCPSPGTASYSHKKHIL